MESFRMFWIIVCNENLILFLQESAIDLGGRIYIWKEGTFTFHCIIILYYYSLLLSFSTIQKISKKLLLPL